MVTTKSGMVNRHLLIPYMVPYLAYIGIAGICQDQLNLSMEISYGLKLLVVPGLLIWAWPNYASLWPPGIGQRLISIAGGIAFGILGVILWSLLLIPFTGSQGEAWTETAFGLRLVSASLVVPVFEELFIRGYVLRLAYQWEVAKKQGIKRAFDHVLDHANIHSAPQGAWSALSVLISNMIFVLGHHVTEWPAAFAYGLLITLLWGLRKDLLSCIIAHGTTNLILGIYVYTTGSWGLW